MLHHDDVSSDVHDINEKESFISRDQNNEHEGTEEQKVKDNAIIHEKDHILTDEYNDDEKRKHAFDQIFQIYDDGGPISGLELTFLKRLAMLRNLGMKQKKVRLYLILK